MRGQAARSGTATRPPGHSAGRRWRPAAQGNLPATAPPARGGGGGCHGRTIRQRALVGARHGVADRGLGRNGGGWLWGGAGHGGGARTPAQQRAQQDADREDARRDPADPGAPRRPPRSDRVDDEAEGTPPLRRRDDAGLYPRPDRLTIKAGTARPCGLEGEGSIGQPLDVRWKRRLGERRARLAGCDRLIKRVNALGVGIGGRRPRSEILVHPTGLQHTWPGCARIVTARRR